MLKHPVRKIITDPVWRQLEVAVAAAKHSLAGAPGELSDREFLEAVLHLQRTGSPWRDLPPELGYWHAVYMRFRRWEARGVWQRLWQNLQAEHFADARAVLLDSTTVRAHPHAAGAPKKTLGIRLWAARAAVSRPKSTRRRSTRTALLPST
jgi:transposase